MKRTTLAALCAGLFALPAAAQDTPLLDQIVVTATRVPEADHRPLAATTVITRSEIERARAHTVAELLAGHAGVGMANSGGLGAPTSLFLRGSNAGHSVVLLDGVRLGSATLGTVALQDIPLTWIERIEVVRGPLSSLYGADAIGGVVQLFTRTGQEATGVSASAGLGSRDTRQASARFAHRGERGWLNIGASHFRTEGFDACRGSLSAGCFTIEPDRDGYRNDAVQVRGGYRVNDALELDVSLLRAEGEVEFDGSFQNAADNTQQVLGANLNYRVSANWQTRIGVGQSRDLADQYLDGQRTGGYVDTRRTRTTWQNDVRLAAAHTLTVGLEREEDEVRSNTAYAVTSRSVNGVYSQYLGRIGAHDFQVALRHDDNSQFGGATTGNLVWGFALGEGVRGMLGYGEAFRAPSFNDLYWPGFGNPRLKPERSRNLEMGVNGRLVAGGWSLNAYQNRVRDLIAFDSGISLPNNIAQARLRGLEGVVWQRLGDWDARLSLSLQDPQQVGGANHGKRLNRRAERLARLDLAYDAGDWRGGLSLRGEGRRYEDLANTQAMPAFAVLDLYGEYRLAKDWRILARLENALDASYQTARHYHQPGRGVFLSLSYQPR